MSTPLTPEVPRLAKVVRHIDKNGTLAVQLLKKAGSPQTEGNIFNAYMLSPFAGQTAARYRSSNNDYDGTQKSYGMWFVPPDIDTQVLVIFVGGETGRAYWLGCVSDDDIGFAVPGMAATQFNVDGGTNTAGQLLRVPVAEVNKVVAGTDNDGNKSFVKVNKPTSLLAKTLTDQGLNIDDIRGITSSSSARELPSNVYGISTPGPVDRRPDAPKGPYGPTSGTSGASINVPSSRLGGSTFVMDDGSSQFRRVKKANAGPPKYASVSGGETDGDPTIPHNELVRIRTRTGHQILLHNSEDLIYIGNASGTSWIELSSNGKIDIFAQDSISIHTKQDMNFYADRDINMEAGRNINVKASGTNTTGSVTGRIQVESAGDRNVIVGKNYKVSVVGDYINVLNDFNVTTTGSINLTSAVDTNINSTNNILLTANTIGENGPVAPKALTTKPVALTTFSNIYDANGSTLTSIMKRIPAHEPWPQHENLDPLTMTPDKTDRENSTPIKFSNGSALAPEFYNKYTTATDVFDYIPVQSDTNQ